ncbi:glutamate--tRNA ligase [bacterium]|nr:glutamate--tRNA ligase [bacterium]
MTRTRFAPSPTGYLHAGNVRTAIFSALAARAAGGAFILRIEDTDPARSRRAFEDAIIEDLSWLGLHPDEGPNVGGNFGPYRQTERHAAHNAAIERLVAMGAAYRCYCTAEELELERRAAQARHEAPRYSGRCRQLSADEIASLSAEGRRPVIRFRMGLEAIAFVDLVHGRIEFPAGELDDFIVRRADGTAAFLFASALDDADMRITHVVRGNDHISNTPRQIALLRALGHEPPLFAHIGLVHGPDGRPLSKRDASATARGLREAGYEPEAVLAATARIGWRDPEPGAWSIEALARRFAIGDVSPGPAAWDPGFLDHANASFLRTCEEDRWRRAVREAGVADGDVSNRALALIRPEVRRRADIPALIEPFRPGAVTLDDDAAQAIADDTAPAVLAAFGDALADSNELDADGFRAVAKAVAARTGARGRALYMPLRAALTGRTHGPDLPAIIDVLGLAETRERLARAAGISRGAR